MGAEFDAEITLDGRGNAMADGGICATLRDMGRFGLLFGGAAAEQPGIVPAAWIRDIIAGAPDGPAAFVPDEPGYAAGAHYRNCWWVREPEIPFFHASGINGQNVFIHGPSQVVVVKLSTWPTALSPAIEMTVDAVLAIATALRD